MGISRLGSSFSVLDYWTGGSTLALRAFGRISNTLSVSGTDESDVPLVLFQPFALHTFVHFGSAMSVYGNIRFGSALSVLDCVNLASTVSLRSYSRLGASLSVLSFMSIGSTVSLRNLARFGASLSVLGATRFGQTLSVFDSVCIHPDKIVKVPGWSIAWDQSNAKLKFLKDGVSQQPLTVKPAGGDLHGTWMAESIISASDRRLKHDVQPLSGTLRERTARLLGRRGDRTSGSADGAGAQAAQGEQEPSAASRVSLRAGTASQLLQNLRPRRVFEDAAGHTATSHGTATDDSLKANARYLFDAQEVEASLPELIRKVPSGDDVGILYQDFIALITLAAQEQQRKLDENEAQEAEENARLLEQEATIRQLEQQVSTLNGRFARLRWQSPKPPALRRSR